MHIYKPIMFRTVIRKMMFVLNISFYSL